FLESNNLYQLVDNPTRITRSGESIRDLIISDSPGFFVSSGTLSPPANCDHCIIYANFNFFLLYPKINYNTKTNQALSDPAIIPKNGGVL
ncbi:unnamed protein product, partial [Porites evermanni]